MFYRHVSLILFALLASLGGCGEPVSTDVLSKPISQEVDTETPEQPVPTVSSLEQEPTVTTDATVGEEDAIKTATEIYQPPYPDRVDLFLAPKRRGRKNVLDEQENAVELLGFVNVDHLCAVLMINGAVYPVAEGDSHFGVEVISIQPPAVVLQRGRQRWQATLEN